MDLIAGLPKDTPKGFRYTLDTVLALDPANITVHTLALKKGSRLMSEDVYKRQPVHDGHPGLDAVLPHHGDALCDASGVVRRLEDAAPPRLNPPEELGEAPKRVGAEDQIHMPEGLPQFFCHVGLLSHAAAQADDLVGVFPLGVGRCV